MPSPRLSFLHRPWCAGRGRTGSYSTTAGSRGCPGSTALSSPCYGPLRDVAAALRGLCTVLTTLPHDDDPHPSVAVRAPLDNIGLWLSSVRCA